MRINEYFAIRLSKHLRRHVHNYQANTLPKGIVFVTGATRPRKDYLCIMTREGLLGYSGDIGDFDDTYLFVAQGAGDAAGAAGAAGASVELPQLDRTSCFEVGLDSIALYNELQDALDQLGSSLMSRSAAMRSLGDFLHGVINLRITRDDEIKAGLGAVCDINIDEPFRVMIFEACDGDGDGGGSGGGGPDGIPSGFANSLSRIFPYTYTTMYFNRLIALVQPTNRAEDAILLPSAVEEALDQLCRKSACRCGISNTTRNWEALRYDYMAAQFALNAGKKLAMQADTRLFFAEEYYMYHVIDLALHGFVREHGSDKYVYMLHPGVVALIRYDASHVGDLFDLLYCYLCNERNITKTAAQSCMHRNTVVYKMKQIAEILEDDLENVDIRNRVLLSCIIVRYCKYVLGIEIKPFPVDIKYNIKPR